MFIAVQVGLLVLGLYLMSRGRFHIGNREVANPMASVIGIVLIAQLPIALLIGIVLGLTAEPPAPAIAVPTRAGEVAPVVTVAPPRSTNEDWWVDPLITCGAVVLAASLTALALQTSNETEDVFARLQSSGGDAAP
jgi:hypothetical protein